MENLPSYSRAHYRVCNRCCLQQRKKFQLKGFWLACKRGQCALVLGNMSLKNGFRYMLFNPLLQPLRNATHVLTIAVAQKLINNVALM